MSGRGLVAGVGIFEPEIYRWNQTPEILKAYRIWQGMHERAEPKYIAKRPTYAGTTVAPAFHRFVEFYEWAKEQQGWGLDGFQLDKDLLGKGSLIYSPGTCVFLPQRLNVMITKVGNKTTDLPPGVSRTRDGTYRTYVRNNGKRITLGTYPSIDEAFAIYRSAKEELIREVAREYQEFIEPRAFDALMEYQVDPNHIGAKKS